MSSPCPEITRKEGVPAFEVALADGRVWGLALPGPRIRSATRREDDPFGRPRVHIRLTSRVGYPLGVWRLWDDVRSASRSGDGDFHNALVRLAVRLLLMAHDLEPDEATALLDPRRVDLEHIAKAFIRAAFGGGATPHADGVESP